MYYHNLLLTQIVNTQTLVTGQRYLLPYVNTIPCMTCTVPGFGGSGGGCF